MWIRKKYSGHKKSPDSLSLPTQNTVIINIIRLYLKKYGKIPNKLNLKKMDLNNRKMKNYPLPPTEWQKTLQSPRQTRNDRKHYNPQDKHGMTENTTIAKTNREWQKTLQSPRQTRNDRKHYNRQDKHGMTENTTIAKTNTEWQKTLQSQRQTRNDRKHYNRTQTDRIKNARTKTGWQTELRMPR